MKSYGYCEALQRYFVFKKNIEHFCKIQKPNNPYCLSCKREIKQEEKRDGECSGYSHDGGAGNGRLGRIDKGGYGSMEKKGVAIRRNQEGLKGLSAVRYARLGGKKFDQG